MWFATLKGVAMVDPLISCGMKWLPPVLLEDVVVDHRSLPTAGNPARDSRCGWRRAANGSSSSTRP